MKKRIVILLALICTNVIFAQTSTMNLNFNQGNLISSTDTFKCEGLYTYFTITTTPADTPYTVTLLKNNQIFEQGVYSPLNNQSPGTFILDSLIYAGDYELTVITALNDTLEETFSFYDPDPLSFSYTTVGPESCEPSGEILITNISGGSSPYNLGNVDALGNFSADYFQNSIQTDYTISDVQAGFYTVSLQDSYGCIYTAGNDTPIEVEQGADPINIISATQEDSFRICVQGGLAPFGFILESDTLFTNDSCASFYLCPDDYTVIVFDAVQSVNCSDTLDFTIDDMQGYIDQEESAMVVESGGLRPFSYSWEKDGVLQDGQNDSIYSGGLCPGEYVCNILDRSNCSFFFDLTIDEMASGMVEEVDCFDESFSSLDADISGGTPPYEYLWSNGETTPIIENLSPQSYKIEVTDKNGCEFSDELEVPVVLDSCLFNAFSPNGDLVNDTWNINSSFLYENSEVIIYNRWGAKVYQSLGYKNPWDGKNEAGNIVKEGVYFYSILLNNGHDKIKGSLSVFH